MSSTSSKPHAPSAKRLARSPQKRRPLHERSGSHANEIASSTIRIISDPDTQIYSKTPLPSHPSQVLPPRKTRASAFEVSYSVSDENAFASTAPRSLARDTLQPRVAKQHVTSSTISDFQPSPNGSRFHSSDGPSQSAALSSLSAQKASATVRGLSAVQEEPTPRERLTIRPVVPSNTGIATPTANRLSQTSLASSASSDTLAARKHEDRRTSVNSRLFSSPPRNLKRPRSVGPDSHRSKQAVTARRVSSRPISKDSAGLPAFSDNDSGSNERPRSASSPATPSRATLETASANVVKVQYPTPKSAAANTSWAEAPGNSFKQPPRTYDGYQRQPLWISRLSAIPSEPDYLLQASSEGSGQNSRPRRRTTGSVAGGVPLIWSGSSSPIPKTLMSKVQHRPERDFDEQSDTLGDLQRLPLRRQRSGYSAQFSVESRPTSQSDAQSERGSQGSIVTSLPAWTKSYYRHGEHAFIAQPGTPTNGVDSRLTTPKSAATRYISYYPRSENTSIGALESFSTETTESRLATPLSLASLAPTNSPVTDHLPLSIFRPRTRPHQMMEIRNSMLVSEPPPDEGGFPSEEGVFPPEQEMDVQVPPTRVSEPIPPHLQRDRRSTVRLSAWRAPSFDDSLGSLLLGRANRQMLLFCLGFIFPLAWIIAAFLPLPVRHELSKEDTSSQVDMEHALARDVNPLNELRYHKARWWRNLNRIMSLVGLLIIGGIIALAVTASRA